MLKFEIEENCPLKADAEFVSELIKERFPKILECNMTLLCSHNGVRLCLDDKDLCSEPFQISLCSGKLLWRLNHSGKKSEAVCRAVMGKLDKPVVFDATAGLGRESMILQSAGCSVTMFERNPVIYLLLKSALYEAQHDPEVLSSLKNGLPALVGYGSVKEMTQSSAELTKPDVIYYDPMFPERNKSALVKKEMRIFHELVGFDEDTLEYANYLCTRVKHHLVVKRPGNEKPLELNVRRSSFVDGKACRFDCYYVNEDN